MLSYSSERPIEQSDHKVEDKFKTEFKYYKANKPLPSLKKVLTISKKTLETDKRIQILSNVSIREDTRVQLLGLEDVKKWEIYTLKSNPGLIFIKNPFTSLGQRYWIRKCLEEYTRKPNKANIDFEIELNDWWADCYKDGKCDRILQKKMRWTTLGYHHNWDTKVYSEKSKNIFPADLSELCDIVANVLGYVKFKPQAAIVNYYHMDSTLSAHTDHSEINLEAPLFSFSFGQAAVFLIGGTNKSIIPTSIMLDSGDILVMTKEARLCYHAVPKILPASESPWNDVYKFTCDTDKVFERNFNNLKYIDNVNHLESIRNNKDNAQWSRFNDYINQSRINVNVRQVLNETQTCIC